MKKITGVVIVAAYVMTFAGCAENQTKVGEGAAMGGIMGAVLGGVIGNQMKGHNAVNGALLGGALGATAGGVVGSQMPKNPQPKAGTVSEAPAQAPAAGYTSLSVEPVAPGVHVTLQQVVDWTRQGLSSDSIITSIKNSNSTYRLMPDDVNYLRQQGVSERVIETMQAAR